MATRTAETILKVCHRFRRREDSLAGALIHGRAFSIRDSIQLGTHKAGLVQLNWVRTGFALSALLNLAFIWVLVISSRNGTLPATQELSTTPSAFSAPVVNVLDQDYAQYRDTLLSRGMSEAEVKALLLLRLEGDARAHVSRSSKYWLPHEVSDIEDALQLLDELDRGRATFAAIFGADVDRDPAFAPLYRPLDPILSFLSSAQQIRLQRLKLEDQLTMTKVARKALLERSAPNNFLLTAASEADRSARMHFHDKLVAEIKEPLLTEYLLRDSPLASQLHASDVRFTEQEYRSAFSILNRLDGSAPDQKMYAESRSSLRAVLGSRRFAQVWSVRDPTFPILEDVTRDLSLSEDTFLSVYELFNNHQDEIVGVALASGGDSARLTEGLHSVQARFDQELSGLVGNNVADAIVRGYTQQTINMNHRVPRK